MTIEFFRSQKKDIVTEDFILMKKPLKVLV